MSAPSPGAGVTPTDSTGAEARREAYTMALYVAICLLAVLTAVSDDPGGDDHLRLFELIWGTTVGLSLAHWFAFRLSARLVGAGTFDRHNAEAAAAQLAGAVAVAVLATVPVLILPTGAELDVVRLLLAGFVAAVAFAVARSGGAGIGRSAVYAGAVLVLASVIAVMKNVLGAH
ncbi:MAG: hypothetical protein JXA83_01895 [Acidimicrobiales bacterium]|nr:hypothetical protein [Acidimicrobiales bacterium]